MLIEVYEPDQKVFAITESYSNGKPSFHFAIHEAYIDSVNIDNKNHESHVVYWLKTPSGEQWGADVEAEDVSDDFESLVDKLKERWQKDEDFK